MQGYFISDLFAPFQDMDSKAVNENAQRIIQTLCFLTDVLQAIKYNGRWTDEILEFRYGKDYTEMYDEILRLANLLILDVSEFIKIK